jgi:hypothetical protein
MSQKHGADTAPPSRRSVVKGAAWAVPAVVVAGAAPTVAASAGFLTLNGNACKLPGNSQSTFKGYVFEAISNNVTGPLPRDAIVEITSITVAGSPDLGAYKVVLPGGAQSCSCSCGTLNPNHVYCSPDGSVNQRVLIYSSADVTGNSANSTVTITYRIYDCAGGSVCPGTFTSQDSKASLGNTPPIQGGCTIVGAQQFQP